jgi:Tat protein translocase TatB subunit
VPQLSPIEILVVATIALIVFGPEKLPQIARTIGRGASELRRMASDVKEEFEAGLELDDDRPKKKPSRRPHPNELAAPKPVEEPSDRGDLPGDESPADEGPEEGQGGRDDAPAR